MLFFFAKFQGPIRETMFAKTQPKTLQIFRAKRKGPFFVAFVFVFCGVYVCVWGVAWMIASKELYAPISCILLVMRHQMFQECSPIVQTQDQPRELPPTGDPMSFRSPAPKGSRGQMLLPGKARNRSLVLLPPKGWMTTLE